MKKASFFLLINGLLLIQVVHGNTQVKPPQGPFVSMLRDTFVAEEKVNTYKGTLETEKKEYKFSVPDLGRYSEKEVNSVSNKPKDLNVPAFTVNPINIPNARDATPRFQVNAFDNLPIESHQQVAPSSPKFGSINKISPAVNGGVKSQSFDDLPIVVPNNAENNFYPPEWTHPNPLGSASNTRKNSPPNSIMNGSFPRQMPPWMAGAQKNNGYQ